jgi:hypothetical protein
VGPIWVRARSCIRDREFLFVVWDFAASINFGKNAYSYHCGLLHKSIQPTRNKKEKVWLLDLPLFNMRLWNIHLDLQYCFLIRYFVNYICFLHSRKNRANWAIGKEQDVYTNMSNITMVSSLSDISHCILFVRKLLL